MAEIGTEIAQFEASRNRNEVRFLIAGDYIELCKLANQKKVLEDNIALAETVAEVMRSRVENMPLSVSKGLGRFSEKNLQTLLKILPQ